jgi:hypothetical protein
VLRFIMLWLVPQGASRPARVLAIHRGIMSSFSFQRFTLPVASRQLRSTFPIRLVLRNVTLSVSGTSRR